MAPRPVTCRAFFVTPRSASVLGRRATGSPLTLRGGRDSRGRALRVDHLDAEAVRVLVDRIRSEQGRLDVLVNDIFGGDRYAQWQTPFWEHDLEGGLRMLRMGIETHVITASLALPGRWCATSLGTCATPPLPRSVSRRLDALRAHVGGLRHHRGHLA